MIYARLQGGMFDGAKDVLDAPKPPNLVGAWMCPHCNNIHISPYFEVRDLEPIVKLVRYRFIHLDDKGALYRYADPNRDSSPEIPLPDEVDIPQLEPVEPESIPA